MEKISMDKSIPGLSDPNLCFPHCVELHERYEKLMRVGQGTFGEVSKGINKATKELVALKKVLMENEKAGFPITALREIRILKLLDHENVIKLLDICRTNPTRYNRKTSTFFLVFPFCDQDLAGLLATPEFNFTVASRRCIIYQMFSGLYYLHTNTCLHRDMKAANLLITKDGVLKLADFGLARPYALPVKQPNMYTNRVVTLWYRPPELILGEHNYGPPIDIWGAGCIMAELWTRAPILPGATEACQIKLICRLCGSINPETWKNVDKLKEYPKLQIPQNQKRRLRELLKPKNVDGSALDLLDRLLTLNPKNRITGDEILDHQYFYEAPLREQGKVELVRELERHKGKCMFELYSRKRPTGPGGANGGGGPQKRPMHYMKKDHNAEPIY